MILNPFIAVAFNVIMAAGPAFSKTGAVTVNPRDFASRRGTQFILHDSVFYFAGTNIYDLFTYGNGSNAETDSGLENMFMNKARIDSQFARMEKIQARVVRTWMFNHQAWHGFEIKQGVYEKAQFSLFDYIIEAAKKHRVMLVPALENYWEAYGGIDSVLRWNSLSSGQAGRWKFFNREKCPGCFTTYKNYVSYVLNRVNHYSGVAYKDDPTIFAWDLMNEPRYENATPNENTTGVTMRLWIDTMAAFVKSIDKNHMVCAGFEGQETAFGYGGDCGNPFGYVQASPYIDFTSAHPYPTEGWAGLNIDKTVTLLKRWISISHDTLGKPFFLGEFNAHNNNGSGTRSEWWTAIYGELEKSGANGSAFWWFSDRPYDNANFGVTDGAAELSVFTAHSKRMSAKNTPVGTVANPSSIKFRSASRVKVTFISGRTTEAKSATLLRSPCYSLTGREIKNPGENTIVIEKVIGR
jgi:endo-1,4-beta-mannosidase